jgi:hypothetical protein
VPAWLLVGLGGALAAWNAGLVLHWVLYPEDRQAGLVWARLLPHLFRDIPRRGPALLRQLLLERGSLVKNPGQ